MSKVDKLQFAKDLQALLEKHIPDYGQTNTIEEHKAHIEAILDVTVPFIGSYTAGYGIHVSAVTNQPAAMGMVFDAVLKQIEDELRESGIELLTRMRDKERAAKNN